MTSLVAKRPELFVVLSKPGFIVWSFSLLNSLFRRKSFLTSQQCLPHQPAEVVSDVLVVFYEFTLRLVIHFLQQIHYSETGMVAMVHCDINLVAMQA